MVVKKRTTAAFGSSSEDSPSNKPTTSSKASIDVDAVGTSSKREVQAEDVDDAKKIKSKKDGDTTTAITSSTYWLTRIALLRFLGFLHFVAFLVAYHQLPALIGKDGLYPAHLYLKQVKQSLGARDSFEACQQLPSLFWFVDLSISDTPLQVVSAIGLAISSFIVIRGAANVFMIATLWVLYTSIHSIGQLFYGYGWEIQLLETTFLALWMCPVFSLDPLPHNTPTPFIVVLLFRWLLFRIMLGAGLIKIRGDQCWRDLTCLDYHYETQPIPSVISWYLHQMPHEFQALGVLANHFVELVAPFMLLIPHRYVIRAAGVIQILFQVLLIVSGNLSFLNYLTIVPAIACFDDASLTYIFSRKTIDKLRSRIASTNSKAWTSRVRLAVSIAIMLLIAYLSYQPVMNLLSSEQRMNSSFDRLHLVNTYGAFGSVGKVRNEVIISGTTSNDPFSPKAVWTEYDFKAKPGNVTARPPFIAPYHRRLDWQIWFAAMQSYQHNPWLLHFVAKLLKNDTLALGLISSQPKEIPKFIKVDLYQYQFTTWEETKREEMKNVWWKRKYIREYLPPLSLDNPSFISVLKQFHWI